ncbi:MAG: hypothetical protein BYD32DRAFT_207743 [Podila humilis]|nr:MAG: hypothetical protein BYD32DRAFT_207743 [Podila humilis]
MLTICSACVLYIFLLICKSLTLFKNHTLRKFLCRVFLRRKRNPSDKSRRDLVEAQGDFPRGEIENQACELGSGGGSREVT